MGKERAQAIVAGIVVLVAVVALVIILKPGASGAVALTSDGEFAQHEPIPECENDPDVAGCQAVANNCQAKCQGIEADGHAMVTDYVLQEDTVPGCDTPKKVALESCTVRKDNILCIDVICTCYFC